MVNLDDAVVDQICKLLKKKDLLSLRLVNKQVSSVAVVHCWSGILIRTSTFSALWRHIVCTPYSTRFHFDAVKHLSLKIAEPVTYLLLKPIADALSSNIERIDIDLATQNPLAHRSARVFCKNINARLKHGVEIELTLREVPAVDLENWVSVTSIRWVRFHTQTPVAPPALPHHLRSLSIISMHKILEVRSGVLNKLLYNTEVHTVTLIQINLVMDETLDFLDVLTVTDGMVSIDKKEGCTFDMDMCLSLAGTTVAAPEILLVSCQELTLELDQCNGGWRHCLLKKLIDEIDNHEEEKKTNKTLNLKLGFISDTNKQQTVVLKRILRPFYKVISIEMIYSAAIIPKNAVSALIH